MPKNKPPVVNAGPDQELTLTDLVNFVVLQGTVTDDGLPKNKTVTQIWSKASGPGDVTFYNAASKITNAGFSVAGVYVLRLTATDTQLSANDDVKITVNAGPPTPDPTKPELPRITVDTVYKQPTGNTVLVNAGGDLQTALDTAVPNSVILLEAGAIFTGSYRLPNKTGAEYIYVMSSDLVNIPSDGVRVSPNHAAYMPTIVASDPTSPALFTDTAAHHFRFVGIHFKCKEGQPNNGLVRLGTGLETAVGEFPHHLILDRCIVQGDPATGGRRGVLLAGNYLAVINSYLYNWKLTDRDTQAICGWTGEGPWCVYNNHMEAAAENLLIGGADPAIVGLLPSDIEIVNNKFTKPLIWNPFHSSYNGSTWQCKNALELKVGKRVLIQGNVIEHNWAGAQSGAAVLFTTKNQDGYAVWSAIEDVTFIGNTLNGVLRGISIAGYDGGTASLGGRRILVSNNYFKDLGGAVWGEGQAPSWVQSSAFMLVSGMADVVIDHNTVIHGPFDAEGAFIIADGAPYERFVLINNIWEHNRYGIKGGGTGVGNATLAAYFPGADVRRNVMVGADPASYPTDNFFPATISEVGFVNHPTDVRLASTSLYVNKATDGTGIGATNDVLV